MTIRTRFAPSPTGFLHIGGARTALFNWLLARRSQGTFVLRIEDTDTERSTQESIEQILEGMVWLGLDADDGPFFQMSRLERYSRVANDLIEADKAYRCFCSKEELGAMRDDQRKRGLKPRYDGRCRTRAASEEGVASVVRFKNPERGTVRVRDLIHGEVVFENEELDDLVLLRSDGVPTYNFSVVVDDSEMGITHVVRGDDHLNNTPRQLNLLDALGIAAPKYAHLPMILGDDGSRLSKRHGAMSVLAYRDAGYLSEAVLNYIARLGWSYGDQEIFSLEELQSLFALDGVNHSAASFDPMKFQWVNQQWIKRATSEMLAERLTPFLEARGFAHDTGASLLDLVDVQRDRATTLDDMADKSRFVFEAPDEYAPKAVRQHFKPGVNRVLQSLTDELESLEIWNVDSTQQAVELTAEKLELKLGKVAQPLRVAVTGDSSSPGIGHTLDLIGREKAMARLRRALEFTQTHG